MLAGMIVVIPNLAEVERILVLAMNMDTLVRCFSRRNGHNTLKSLSNWFKEDTSQRASQCETQTDLECTR